jgi:hypothetical protein
MDYDAACVMTGPATPLLNFIGFLIFSAVALWATGGSGDDGHHQRVLRTVRARCAYMPRAFLHLAG